MEGDDSMIDIIILVAIGGYCLWIVMQRYRKKKKSSKNGCNGACVGCSGCGDISHLKEIYDADKREKNHNG